jgi:hypothetical protein
MGKFKLVNPVILGTFSDSYDAKTVENGAQLFWENLTSDNKYITGNIPNFLFTLKDDKNNLHHFQVKEMPSGNSASYTIEKKEMNVSNTQKENFLQEVSKVQKTSKYLKTDQSGGKKKRKRYDDSDDSDSDSDSDSDINDLFSHIRRRREKPIMYWWWTPSLYESIDNMFIPSFVSPLSPYLEVWVPSL